jgi:hypothetical protein
MDASTWVAIAAAIISLGSLIIAGLVRQDSRKQAATQEARAKEQDERAKEQDERARAEEERVWNLERKVELEREGPTFRFMGSTPVRDGWYYRLVWQILGQHYPTSLRARARKRSVNEVVNVAIACVSGVITRLPNHVPSSSIILRLWIC